MELMRNIIDKLKAANVVYYDNDAEQISNYEYDKLYDKLVELEQRLGFTFPDSPTQSVSPTTNMSKVKHVKKMLSLDKTKDINKLRSFIDDKQGLLSWKLDGITVVIKYNNGKPVQIITRGNGEYGEDVTYSKAVFENLPDEITFQDELILRGEAVISREAFAKLNTDNKYKNPRNLCSGLVRNKSQTSRCINFICFELVNIWHETKHEAFEFLNSQDIATVEFKQTSAKSLEADTSEFLSRVESYAYAVDGLVLTFDDVAYSKDLGCTNKFPKDSLAFKWADETATSSLLNVQWNISRTGLMTPVAIFTPVELNDTEVDKASLHNVSIMENLKLGIGDVITVYKANMIIPQIAENLTCSNTLQIPNVCPVCKTHTQLTESNGVRTLSCPNIKCQERIVQALAHFCSRDAMNIEGMSEEIIRRFVNAKFLSENFMSIYELKDYEQEIKFSGILNKREPNKYHKSFTKLMNAIEKSKQNPISCLIFGLGINNVGLTAAKSLCLAFDNDIHKIITATQKDISAIHGLGEAAANSIVDYFADEQNKLCVLQLAEIFVCK